MVVVFLRGVNVGGHKTFRPSALAAQLEHLDAVNIGAAGTFVIRKAIGRSRLRDEIRLRLPFDAEIMICRGRDITGLMAQDFFGGHPATPDVVRFVSVLARLPRSTPQVPLTLPRNGNWLVEVLARHERFVVGLYRREMKAIRELGKLDRIFGAPATTRSWNTIGAIAKVLGKESD